jgi:hypothetical protein
MQALLKPNQACRNSCVALHCALLLMRTTTAALSHYTAAGSHNTQPNSNRCTNEHGICSHRHQKTSLLHHQLRVLLLFLLLLLCQGPTQSTARQAQLLAGRSHQHMLLLN